jgi:Lrp/AsnC family transcriptional regulator for asnA, asnC and gidA|tara:strand:- start:189 stop:620 length:432 start_codon:yes stop_codon:yes gene_type:complete
MLKNLKLINQLRKNSRENLTMLSRNTGIPISTVYEKLKKTDLIKKYTCLLNFEKIGYHGRSVYLVKVNINERNHLEEYLRLNCNVNNLSIINNGYDFIFDVVFKNLKEISDFTKEIEEKFSILSINSHPIIEDIKREDFLLKL